MFSFFFFSSRRRHTRCSRDWSSDVCSSDLNIGSIAGKISYPQRAPYASAKWALVGLTLTLAEEVGRHGIRVNCICPGPVQGQLIEEVIAARARSMKDRKSTRLNSSHGYISYAVFCLKKKK